MNPPALIRRFRVRRQRRAFARWLELHKTRLDHDPEHKVAVVARVGCVAEGCGFDSAVLLFDGEQWTKVGRLSHRKLRAAHEEAGRRGRARHADEVLHQQTSMNRAQRRRIERLRRAST